MAKIQIIFYSTYGHVFQLAEAIAAGAREIAGSRSRGVASRRDTCRTRFSARWEPSMRRRRSRMFRSPIRSKLAEADAIILGTPTRYGSVAAQMRAFLDATGGLVGQRRR